MKQKLAVLNKPIIRVIFLALVPVILCFVGPLLSGKSFFDVWIPYSGRFDEAFLHKQVEAAARFLSPQGYFGLNESSALLRGFGPRGPLPVIPFAPAARIFGWRPLAPCIFNMVILSIAFLAFQAAYRPDMSKTLLFSALVLLFTPVYGSMLSGTGEILFLALTVMLFALVVGENNEHGVHKQLFMMLILAFLVAVRPFYAVLFPLPWLAGRDERARTRFLSVIAVIAGFVGHFLTGRYLTAPDPAAKVLYLGPVGNSQGLTDRLMTLGPKAVASELTERLAAAPGILQKTVINAFKGSDPAGAYWTAFLVMTVLILVNCIICALGASRDYYDGFNAFLSGWLFLGQTVIAAVLLVFYDPGENYRHLFVFLVIDMLTLVFFTRSRYVNTFILAAVCIFFFCIGKPEKPVAFADRQVRERFAYDSVTLEETLTLEEGISWDNTVIVVEEDLAASVKENGDGLEVIYALPAGFGISCCTQEYVLNNMESLRSRYLITREGSDCDVIAHFNGHPDKLASFREYNIYRLR